MGVEVSILLRDLTQTSVDTNTPLLLWTHNPGSRANKLSQHWLQFCLVSIKKFCKSQTTDVEVPEDDRHYSLDYMSE